jgi:hypothetical protein
LRGLILDEPSTIQLVGMSDKVDTLADPYRILDKTSVGCSTRVVDFQLMIAEATRTVPLSSKELESAIDVLSSAGQALQLTRFERLSYRALMVSVDVATVSFVAYNILIMIAAPRMPASDFNPEALGGIFVASIICLVVFLVSIIVGIVSLALNIPVFRKAFRERARLKELGLSSLSRSLWKESRRSRWIRRVRGILLIGTGIYILVFAVVFVAAATMAPFPEPEREARIVIFYLALPVRVL